MVEPALDGYRYDFGKAEAIAGALAPALAQAQELGATPQDRLAALGIAAAKILLAGRLAGEAGLLTQALANLTLDLVRRGGRAQV